MNFDMHIAVLAPRFMSGSYVARPGAQMGRAILWYWRQRIYLEWIVFLRLVVRRLLQL